MLSVQLPLPSLFADQLPAQDPSIPRSLLHLTADSVVSDEGTVDDDIPPSPGAQPNYHYAPRDSRSPTHLSFASATSYATAPYPYTTRASSTHISPYTQPRSYGALAKIPSSNQYNCDNYETPFHSPVSFLPRVASLGSEWKHEPDDPRSLGDASPFQPSFSSISGSSQYPLRSEDNSYGPSPPGTATSSSSTAAGAQESPEVSNKKNFSFVALPGNAVRKRPRRRYDEIERLYHCSWPECTKAYGTLNHLNAHVQMQKHGPKRSPNEFKELRKQWRKAKKEYESPSLGPIRRTGSMSLLRNDELHHGHHPYSHGTPHRSFSNPLSVTLPPHGSYPSVDHGHGQHLRYPPEVRGEIDGMEFNQSTTWTPTPSAARVEMYHQSPLTTQPTYPYLDTVLRRDQY